MIYMRVKVPASLQGGSLLDAHKFVKAQMARTNPGGTPDYTLADTLGNPITLSDLVRRNPALVEIEVISGMGGVRSNPSLPLPADFVPSPDFKRSGNFATQLLPRDLDPVLVERMVAQEGLFGAINTLTILLGERSVDEGISPTTAGLLYAHSSIPRQNPSGKTPFLADVAKEMYDSETTIRRYLDRHGFEDITMQDNIIGKSKLSAKYDLTLANLEQFVNEVLAPFLAVASANRGAIRTINRISAGMGSDEKKNFADNFGKLMYLLPTKPEDFVKGREYGLVASSEFIYPIFAQRLLTPNEIDTLLGVAKKFPNNLAANGKELELSRKEAALIKNRAIVNESWFTRQLNKIPYIGTIMPSLAIEGDSAEAKATLIKGKVPSDKQLISFIVESVNADLARYGKSKKDSKFFFMRDVGGFYPSPPRGWPLQVVYSVMDMMLESLPEIVDIRDPTKNYKSGVSMDFLRSLKDDTTMYPVDNKIADKGKKLKPITYDEFKKTLAGSDADREKLLVGLNVKAVTATGAKTPEDFTKLIFDNWEPRAAELKVNNELGKSVIEMLFDAMEVGRAKYDYEFSDDDITYALTLIDYSIRELFDEGASIAAPTALMTSIFGRKRMDATTEQYERFMRAVASGSFTSGSAAQAAILHLSMVQAYVDAIENDISKTKAVKLTEIATFKASYPPSGVGSVVAGLGNQIILGAEARVTASPP